MNAATTLLQSLAHRGVRIGITDGKLIVDAPPMVLTDADRAELARHKAGLLAALRHGETEPANEPLPEALVRAALRLCAAYGDGPEARQQMLDDLRSYPADRHGWLTDYLDAQADALGAAPDLDDRRACTQCQNFRRRDGACLAARRGELFNAARSYRPLLDTLRRCGGYRPQADDVDPRPGHERWPGSTFGDS
jgi:hypothetical protein